EAVDLVDPDFPAVRRDSGRQIDGADGRQVLRDVDPLERSARTVEPRHRRAEPPQLDRLPFRLGDRDEIPAPAPLRAHTPAPFDRRPRAGGRGREGEKETDGGRGEEPAEKHAGGYDDRSGDAIPS